MNTPLIRNRFFAAAALAVLAGACLYAFFPAIHAGFINFDDFDYLHRNPMVKNGFSLAHLSLAFTSFHASNWHPLTWISHMLDVQLFGFNPLAFHLENILLHIANTLLLVLALRRMTGRFWPAFCVGALFGLHPLRVESVAWVAERKDVLCAFFFMLTLLAYTAYVRRPHPLRYALVCCCLALGLLAKPMLVTVPFVLLLLDFWPFGRLGARKKAEKTLRPLLEKIPLCVLSALSCLMTWLAQDNFGAIASGGDLPLGQRLGIALNAYVAYLEKAFYPKGLALFYPVTELSDARILFCAALLLLISAAVLYFGKKRPYLPVGWFWYLGMLVPVIGIVKVGGQAMADRYTYLPLIGLSLMLVWGVADWLGSASGKRVPRWAPAALLAVLCLTLVWQTRAQATLWQDCRTLYEATIARTGENPIIHYNLGKLLADRNDPHGALREYDLALRSQPRFFEAQNNMAWILATSPEAGVRNGERAITLVRRAMRSVGTRNPGLMDTLAAAYAETGQFETAVSIARQAASIAKLAGQKELAAMIRAHAALFASGTPLRDKK